MRIVDDHETPDATVQARHSTHDDATMPASQTQAWDSTRVAKSLRALAALTQDMLSDVTHSTETEAFASLADEIDSAVGRLADEYMTLKLRLALSSRDEEDGQSLTTPIADLTPPPSTLDLTPPPSTLEQLLFPDSDDGLLDDVLAHETAGSLNMMDSSPSPLDELLCNAPLEPERLGPNLQPQSSDSLSGFGTDVLLSELSDRIFTSSRPSFGPAEVDVATSQGDQSAAVESRHAPSAERLRSWHEEGGTNLRALLASLHTVAPPGSACKWEKTTLSQLVSDATVQRAYRRSILAVHPDKLPPPQREVGQQIFDTLRDAWGAHNGR